MPNHRRVEQEIADKDAPAALTKDARSTEYEAVANGEQTEENCMNDVGKCYGRENLGGEAGIIVIGGGSGCYR